MTPTFNRTIGRLALLGALAVVPQICFAGAGAQMLAGFIEQHIILSALEAFGAAAALAVFYYGFSIILSAYKESALTDAINHFIWAIIGFAVIAISQAFVLAFGAGVRPEALTPGILSVIAFLLTATSGIFTLMITITGLRMLMTQGDSGELSKLFKVLVGNCIGVAICLISQGIVTAVATGAPGPIVEELAGITLFLLTIVGTMCVVAIIVAGVFLIISIREDYRDRAKRAIIGTLIALAVVLASYTLISTFV